MVSVGLLWSIWTLLLPSDRLRPESGEMATEVESRLSPADQEVYCSYADANYHRIWSDASLCRSYRADGEKTLQRR